MTKKERKEYNSDYYQKNKERIYKVNRKWVKEHNNFIKNYLRNYYQINKKELCKKQKEYNQLHKLKIKNYKRQYHLKNKEHICTRSKKWYNEHKEQRKIYNKTQGIINSNKYFIKRRKEDINFKILCNLRIRIWKVLKENSKSAKTLKLIGCSLDSLRLHLQSKFQIGMSFSNYGKWHIDHIRPCSLFDLSKASEQKKCFNYKNLQPLWAKENIRKGKKILTKQGE